MECIYRHLHILIKIKHKSDRKPSILSLYFDLLVLVSCLNKCKH